MRVTSVKTLHFYQVKISLFILRNTRFSRLFAILFLNPADRSPATENTLSTYACDAGEHTKSWLKKSTVYSKKYMRKKRLVDHRLSEVPEQKVNKTRLMLDSD